MSVLSVAERDGRERERERNKVRKMGREGERKAEKASFALHVS